MEPCFGIHEFASSLPAHKHSTADICASVNIIRRPRPTVKAVPLENSVRVSVAEDELLAGRTALAAETAKVMIHPSPCFLTRGVSAKPKSCLRRCIPLLGSSIAVAASWTPSRSISNRTVGIAPSGPGRRRAEAAVLTVSWCQLLVGYRFRIGFSRLLRGSGITGQESARTRP